MAYIRTCLFLAAAVLLLANSTPTFAPTVRQYFGEPIPLSPEEQARFDRGFALFVKDWSDIRDGIANAPSCLACHSVPMPGGSGMSDMALVSVAASAAAGSREEVIQRGHGEGVHGPVRRTPALFGLGFLEAAAANEEADFGFGAHGLHKDLRAFVSGAFATEMGVSTLGHCARISIKSEYPKRCRPRLTEDQLDDVVMFLRFLAPPSPPSRPTAQGQQMFAQLGCASCHTPDLPSRRPTGSGEPLRIMAFSDLKRHNIGTSRKGAVRTAPLWGLNSYGPPYLHDATANSIEAALLAHGEEAQHSRLAFERLRPEEQNALLEYLRSF